MDLPACVPGPAVRHRCAYVSRVYTTWLGYPIWLGIGSGTSRKPACQTQQQRLDLHSCATIALQTWGAAVHDTNKPSSLWTRKLKSWLALVICTLAGAEDKCAMMQPSEGTARRWLQHVHYEDLSPEAMA